MAEDIFSDEDYDFSSEPDNEASTTWWTKFTGAASNAYDGITDGVVNVAHKVNTESKAVFEQENVKGSIIDFMNSAIGAGKDAVKGAIGGKTEGSWLENVWQGTIKRFANSRTGKDIEKVAIQGKIQSWLANPLIMVVATVLVLLLITRFIKVR